MSQKRKDVAEHEAVSLLLPWHVNATLGEQERQRVEAHIALCAACSDDLLRERRIHGRMAAETPVEYMPTLSLNRLRARLDSLPGEALDQRDAPARSIPERRMLLAAALAVLTVGLSFVGADRWMRTRAGGADYHTVTSPAGRPSQEVIRAVFAPNVTLVELQSILDEAQLRIVAGPTEAGVYSLASSAQRPVAASLAVLRSHTTVRFAESTQPDMVAP